MILGFRWLHDVSFVWLIRKIFTILLHHALTLVKFGTFSEESGCLRQLLVIQMCGIFLINGGAVLVCNISPFRKLMFCSLLLYVGRFGNQGVGLCLKDLWSWQKWWLAISFLFSNNLVQQRLLLVWQMRFVYYSVSIFIFVWGPQAVKRYYNLVDPSISRLPKVKCWWHLCWESLIGREIIIVHDYQGSVLVAEMYFYGEQTSM